MGAFSIAFDTIIAGALALPWVLLVIHLFFSDNETSLKNVLDWVTKQNQPAAAGVLLFAMAYSLGSAVSRIAQDFFDDDDLHIEMLGQWFLVGVTESSIRAAVSCQEQTLIPQPLIDSLAAGPEPFSTDECKFTRTWHVLQKYESRINDQRDRAERIFHIQESALLLKGTDATERIRQFHDQIMVLRAAAFDGLVASSLCLVWWSSKFRSRLRWTVLLIFLFPGFTALYHHLLARAASDPPYMEFTLLVLAAAGGRVLWPGTTKGKGAPGELGIRNGRGQIRGAYVVLALFLTATAFLGWWSTQVLYDEQVIYAYKAMSESPTK